MHANNHCDHRSGPPLVQTLGLLPRRRGNAALACIAAAAFLACAAPSAQQTPSSEPDKQQTTQPVSQQSKALEKQNQKQASESSRTEQQKQLVEANAKLLKLATDLKNEVDKTNLDTLSITIIRKADEIEKLAHSVRLKMKVTLEAPK
jgi:hypothetical protein